MKARCIICEESDWKNVDKYIHKPQGAFICKSCGFVTYDSILKKEEMKDFYRSKKNEYRAAPTVTNEYQQERKLHYHAMFLSPLFKEWKKEKKNPVVFESGAAYGRFLNFVRNAFPECELHGAELTLSMRRVAWNYFNIKLDEEFDESRKYDLIASYKCAEHVPDIDLEIRKYAECLTEDGRVYIGVPMWFRSIACFGMPAWSIAEYYHPNHINMWTRKLFESLLKKCGLEVTEENHVFYDSVYLCKRNDSLMDTPIEKEDYKKIIETMKTYKKANDHYQGGRFKQAIEEYPNFPDAYLKHYETNRAQFHSEGLETLNKFLDFAIKSCPDSSLIYNFCGDICARYELYENSVKYFKKSLTLRPNDPVALLNLSKVYRELEHFDESAQVAKHIIETSSQHKNEAITWFLHDLAKIPAEWENEVR